MSFKVGERYVFGMSYTYSFTAVCIKATRCFATFEALGSASKRFGTFTLRVRTREDDGVSYVSNGRWTAFAE